MNNEFFAPSLISNQSETPGIIESESVEIIFCSAVNARARISFEIASRYNILPLQIYKLAESEKITCAAYSNDPELARLLEFQLGIKVELIECPGQNLSKAIYKAYKKNDQALGQLKNQLKNLLPQGPSNIKMPQNISAGDSTEMQFLQALVEYAVASEASDIHLIPSEMGSLLKLRINGSLIEHPETIGHYSQHEVFVNRLKVLARLDISVKSQPQDGGLSIAAMGRNLFIRVSTMPTIAGEKIVLRIQGSKELLSLDKLRLEAKTEKFLNKALEFNEGLIIFCGPTGSGKTTTIYAALNELSKRNLSIVTIEDPVEISFPRAEQTDLSILKSLTYEKALRSVMRQDPDIIVIGEIRESASAELAFNAALTGHLVLTTVHAGSVSGVLRRLKQLGIEETLVSSCTRLIVSQRLVPELCSKCAVIDLVNSNKFEEKIKKATGCQYCSASGYAAQLPVTESLLGSELTINNFYQSNRLLRKNNYYKCAQKELKNLLKRGKIDYASYSYFSDIK